MTYYIIGLMSGSSHDGLDICYSHLTLVSGKKWEYEIVAAECIPYPTALKDKLKKASLLSVPDFLRLDAAFGRFCAEKVNQFINKYDLEHRIFFISSHGHTVWHEPEAGVSTQIGDGATIAALTGYTTISNLRNMDVALGGQGAPIVPIADKYLFPDYDFCLNLGGIANVTVNRENPIAFDICPANQLLDFFAQKKGLDFDKDGQLALSGSCNEELLATINKNNYYGQHAPKSLNNAFSENEIIPIFEGMPEEDALSTAVKHIAYQIASCLQPYCDSAKTYKMLLTGGGALNTYLVEQISQELSKHNLPITCEIPDEKLIKYKEALAVSLIGALRWREEKNVLASATGAVKDSIGGAFWMGNNF